MDISDVFLCTSIDEVQVGSHYDSTFSLVHWIKHCKAMIGLSNQNTNNLVWDVIFHPSFFLENVNIRSIVDLKTYCSKRKMVGMNMLCMLWKMMWKNWCIIKTLCKPLPHCFHLHKLLLGFIYIQLHPTIPKHTPFQI